MWTFCLVIIFEQRYEFQFFCCENIKLILYLLILDKYKSDMLTIEGRQVQVELVSLSELGIQAIPNGLVIPNGLKRKLLDQLNWQEFVRLHCRRRNLGFSEQESFHSSLDNTMRTRFENRGSFYDKVPRTEELSWINLIPAFPVLTQKFNADWLTRVWRFLKSWLWWTQTWPTHAMFGLYWRKTRNYSPLYWCKLFLKTVE